MKERERGESGAESESDTDQRERRERGERELMGEKIVLIFQTMKVIRYILKVIIYTVVNEKNCTLTLWSGRHIGIDRK